MCLAIPGRIVEITDAENSIAKVEVGGVKRSVNIGMPIRTIRRWATMS